MCDFIVDIKKASVRSRYVSYAGFAFAIAHRLYLIDVFKLSPYVVTAFAVFLLSLFAGIRYKDILGVGCRSPPASLNSKKFRLEAAVYEQEQTGHDVLPTPKRGNTF